MSFITLLASGSGGGANLVFKYNVEDDPNYVFGNPVNNLLDQSGNGFNFANTGANKFTYSTDGAADRVLQHPGSTVNNTGFIADFAGNIIDAGDSFYFFVACRPIYLSSIGLGLFYDPSQPTSPDERFILGWTTDQAGRTGYFLDGSWYKNTTNSVLGTYVISYKCRLTENIREYNNNTLLAVPGNIYAGKTFSNSSFLFCVNAAGTGNFRGNVYEVRIYSGEMSDVEYTNIVNEMNIH